MANILGRTFVVTTKAVEIFLNVLVVEKQKKNSEELDSIQKPVKMKVIEVSMQEIWQQTTPKIHRNQKTYNRKLKHKKNDE